ncbi:phage tail terminator protein [Photobacterium sanguinicancri]|uniref:phage tail terminator protein n=1 Tax=Photobacterium sanguinicancri TaxID=875932 RepID=UPI0026E3F27E|nr:hypothetical protein [Photobacterium sanguinicancri]MDO6497327.1 hypothetical protein [Photobacterium sanguinicancri]
MADLIELTVSRLKDKSLGKPPWLDVHEIDDLTQVHAARSNRMPCLYVFLVSDSPRPDVRGSGAYLQSCTATVGVLISMQSINSKRIDWTAMRKAIRGRLFGWTPHGDFEPYWLGSGRLFNIANNKAAWLDQFVTEYTEDQLNYGA